jgi:hypothetical protein
LHSLDTLLQLVDTAARGLWRHSSIIEHVFEHSQDD